MASMSQSWQQLSWLFKALLYGIYAYAPGIGKTDDAALLRIILKMAAVQGALLLPPMLLGLTRQPHVLTTLFVRVVGTLNCMCLAVYLGRNAVIGKTDAELAVVMSTTHMFTSQSAFFFGNPRVLSYAALWAWTSIALSLYFPVAMLRVIGGDQPTAVHVIAIFMAGELFDLVSSLSARATMALGDAYAALMAG